jgi:hypothetical protein
MAYFAASYYGPRFYGPRYFASGAAVAVVLVDVRAALVAHLAADTDLVSLVGTRIRPIVRMQKDRLDPTLTYQMISKVDIRDLDGGSGKARARFQLDCWSRDLSTSAAMARRVRALLHGFKGAMAGLTVAESTLADEADRHETTATSDLYRVQMDFMIQYQVTIPMF